MLVMFAFGLIVFFGTVAMSVDVGRYVWARTQMQSAVDSAALAAAQSLPSTTGATNNAFAYYQDNAEFIINADPGAAAPIVTFPNNRSVHVRGEAEIPTWFARIFGIDHWTVSAEGRGEIVVLDAMIVMDRSGSMCFEHYGNKSGTSGRTYEAAFRLQGAITETATTIPVIIDTGLGALSNVAYVGQIFDVSVRNSSNNTVTERMRITALQPGSPNQITVVRDTQNAISGSGGGTLPSGTSTSARPRPWGSSCQMAGPEPFQPWENVNYAASLFPDKLAVGYDRVGYVQYGTNAQLHTPLSTNLSGVRASIQNAPSPTDGSTNIANGLGLANAQLVNNGSPTADYVIILVTDGEANRYCSTSDQVANCSTGSNTSTAKSRARAQADWAASRGIKIYTIGYGTSSAYDEALLEYIASVTGGVFYPAPNQAAVDAAFTDIAFLVRVKLTQ